jgi:hypothetical protein
MALNGQTEEWAHREREDRARGRERESARARGRVRLAAAWVAAARQEELALKREHNRKRKEAEEAAAWKHFVQAEQRQLQLRKDGQLANQLGEPRCRESSLRFCRDWPPRIGYRPNVVWWH